MTTSPLADTLAAVRDFVLEPPDAAGRVRPTSRQGRERLPSQRRGATRPRPLEAFVAGLAPGCGATTLARGLAASLSGPSRPARVVSAVATRTDGREERAGADGHATVLAALAGSTAIVWDVGAMDPRHLRAARRGAGPLVMVAPGAGEPALAEIAAAILARRSGRVIVAANRVREPERWAERAAICLPESRIGAAIAVRGRRPPGRLGAALAQLAEAVEAHAP